MKQEAWNSDAPFDDKRERVENEQKQKTTHNFYIVTYNKGNVKIDIDLLLLARKLMELGVYRYDLPNGAGSQIVYIHENKVKVVDKKTVIDIFEDYVQSIGNCEWSVVIGKDSDGDEIWDKKIVTPDMIRSRIYKNQDFYFGTMLERLRPEKPINILTEDKYTKYLFFRNCVVVIQNTFGYEAQAISIEDCFKIVNYNDLQDGYIWEESIIDKDFYYTDEMLGDFEMFIQRICGTQFDYVLNPLARNCDAAQERVLSLMSLLGYLMHDNYDCDELAVIFTDVNKEGLEAAGGTGKGLLGKSLGQILNRRGDCGTRMLTVPGKSFDATKETRYAAGDITTQLIHIEDAKNSFKIEDLYNDIADGATFRPLFQNPTIHKCKFMISMNQALKIETEGSDGRRVVIFELANFFNATRRPAYYFGQMYNMKEKRFWSNDWSAADWCEFYSFMIRCAVVYLTRGIITPNDVNFAERAAKRAIGSEDMWAYLETTFKSCIVNRSISSKWNKATLWAEFNGRYFGTYKTQKIFSEKVITFLKYKHIRTGIYRDGKNDWFWLNPTPEEISSHSMEIKIR